MHKAKSHSKPRPAGRAAKHPESLAAQAPGSQRVDAPDPGRGPRLLFFSGGSAMHGLARELRLHTHNSIHLVPPFDSGGSSGALRQAFDMPAIGDLRSRLIALASPDLPGAHELEVFFEYRLPEQGDNASLRLRINTQLETLGSALAYQDPERFEGLRCSLQGFLDCMPASFSLRGACLGNLVLTGAYLQAGRDLELASERVSAILGTLGTVRCTVADALHLSARLDSGEIILGQHRLTGKEVHPLQSGIGETWLSATLEDPRPRHCDLPAANHQRIISADALIYAPGSFHTSLMAHFQPRGVGAAIAANRGVKIYIPNLGLDPELRDRTPLQALGFLVKTLHQSTGDSLPTKAVLSHLLLDHGQREQFPPEAVESLGIKPLYRDLTGPEHAYYAPDKVIENLLGILGPRPPSRL